MYEVIIEIVPVICLFLKKKGTKRDLSCTPLVTGVIVGTLAGLVTGALIGIALKRG